MASRGVDEDLETLRPHAGSLTEADVPTCKKRCLSPSAWPFWVALAFAVVAVVAIVSVYGAAPGGLRRGPLGPRECDADIWLVRHGERAGAGPSLNNVGLLRSFHFVDMVKQGKMPTFGALIAADPLKNAASQHLAKFKSSWHMYQLLLPLSASIGVPVDISHGQTEYAPTAAAMLDAARKNCGGTVLVAWDHCQLPSLLQEAGCDLPECKRCMPDVWFDTVYKTKVKFTGAKLDNVTWVSATLGKQGFKGHEDPPVSTKDLYNGHLGYYHCATENMPWKWTCQYGDDMKKVAAVWDGPLNPYFHGTKEEQRTSGDPKWVVPKNEKAKENKEEYEKVDGEI